MCKPCSNALISHRNRRTVPPPISPQLQPVFRDLTMQAVASTEIHVHTNITVFPVFSFFLERKTIQISINVPKSKILCHARGVTNCVQRTSLGQSTFCVMQNHFLLYPKLLKSLAEYTLSTPFSFPKHLKKKECLLS